jgi:hypothetical protein
VQSVGDAGLVRGVVVGRDTLEHLHLASDVEVVHARLDAGGDDRFVRLDERAGTVQEGVHAVEVRPRLADGEGAVLTVVRLGHGREFPLVPSGQHRVESGLDGRLDHEFAGVAVGTVDTEHAHTSEAAV